jgi:hypothetical protein
MDKQKIVVKFDKVALVKATSRNKFRDSIPRPKRLDDKRKRPAKYAEDFRKEYE